MARDNDDRHFGVVALHGFQDIDPVHLAVLQPDIENKKLRRLLVDFGHRGVGCARKTRGMPLVAQDVSDQFADVAFVVYDQDVAHNSLDPFCSCTIVFCLKG